ncbi:MAG: hypothetical protein JW776_14295 [Candidatus Lokiarchaeota archaeon]|nr:hypothetical protein [Candidatus Lokiarchaeota archaeon]
MTSRFDIIFIGHFARDTIITADGTFSNSLGGGVTFGSLSAHNYNQDQKIGIFSEVGKNFDKSWLDIFNSEIYLNGVNQSSEHTTHYKIRYFPEGGRTLTLESRAKSLEYNHFPSIMANSRSFMISSIANEISEKFIIDLLEHSTGWIGVDIQGFIRDFHLDGTIKKEYDDSLIKSTKNIIEKCGERLILKASDDEIKYIAQNIDVIQSTKHIARLGNFILCTTLGSHGSLIKYRDEKMIHIPAFIPERGVADETGAGDCYLATFLSEYINSDYTWDEIKRCGYVASCAASFLLEEKGPHGFASKKQIDERLQKMKTIPSPFHKKVKYNSF